MRNSESSGQPIKDVETLRQHKLKTERLRRKVTWQKKMQTANGVDKPQAARRTGIDIVGNVPWGTHLCVFYQDKQDLIDILVPYFKAGLENNEFCMWITSEPLNANEAELSLRQAVNNLDDYIEKGQIEILDYNHWYTKSGSFDADEVLQGWSEKYEQAIKRGFDGLRATGNALWLDKRDWLKITRYEAAVNDIFDDCRALAICTYSLNKCGTSEAIDVVCNHQFALIRRDGRWELVESSELRNVTKALQNALKQWETTFNTTQDSIILIDPDFTILKANMATSNLLGKPLDDILGSKCYELFHGTNAAPDICPHKKVKETKKHGEMELHIPDKDIWIAISTDPILDENGNMSGMVHVVRNITEKKKMMEALRDSKEKIHSFLELSPDFIIIVDTDHTIQFINRTASGQEVEKVIGKSAYEFIESRYHEDVRKALSQTFATGQSCSLVTRGIDTNDKKRWFENRLAPIKHNVSVVAVMIVSTDITKRRKAEEKLKQSREFLNNTINALDDTFFVKDEEHRWTVLNDAACKAIGRPREELIGKSDYDLFPKEQADVFWEKDNLVFKTGKTSINEEEVTWQGKLHTISTKKSVFKDFITGKKFIVGTARDITERKQMEKTLRENEQRYRSFVENFQGIAFRGKMNFTPIFFHGVVEQITGYTVDEFLSGKPRWNQIIHEDDMNIITGISGKRIAEIPNSSVEREYRIVRKDGQIRWVHEFIRNICDDSGKPTFVEGIIYDISERKKAEEALHESEQKYRALIEQSMHGIIILQDYRIVFANKAACEIPGLTMQEMHDLSFEDMMAFVPPENRSTIQERLKDRFAGRDNVPQNYELRLLRKNGEEFWLNLFFSPIDYQGRPAIQLAFTDITDQKRMEETLRRSEKRFREIFENTAVGIYRTTPDGQILMANPAIVHMLGYPSFEELSQRNLEEEGFEPQYRRSMFKEEIEQKGRIDGWESVWTTRDGKMLNVIENARAVRDEDGKIIYYEGTAENITERKKAEEALIESEEKFRNLAEQSPNMIFINKRGRVVYANEKCEEVMGYKREEFYHPDFDFMTLIAPEYKQLIKTNFSRHMSGEEIKPYEYGLITKDGERLDTIITTKLMKYEGEDSILGTITDITERKQAEEKLREYQEQLKSLASELTLAEERERRRIATELHDEISQSLFISKMKLETLQKAPSDKKFNETLDEINDSLGRILAAIRSLTFDLSSPILYEFGFEEAVAEWLNEQVEGKYGIETEFRDDGLSKPLDDDIRVLLFRNVRELLINVVKHASAKKIKVSIQKVDSRIRICIEDDGVGFDSTKAESLITSKKAFGLFSIRERLENLGGNLEIVSSPGCGCRITITSPLN